MTTIPVPYGEVTLPVIRGAALIEVVLVLLILALTAVPLWRMVSGAAVALGALALGAWTRWAFVVDILCWLFWVLLAYRYTEGEDL